MASIGLKQVLSQMLDVQTGIQNLGGSSLSQEQVGNQSSRTTDPSE